MLMLCRLGVLIMYKDVCDKGTFVDVHVVTSGTQGSTYGGPECY